MADVPLTSALSGSPHDDLVARLDAVAPELADAVVAALRERDDLIVLRDAVADAEAAPSLEARLRAIANAVQRLGFGGAAIVLVSRGGAAEFVIAADGAPDALDEVIARARPSEWGETVDPPAAAVSLPMLSRDGSVVARLVLVPTRGGSAPYGNATVRLLATHAARSIDDARQMEAAERRSARLQRLQEVGGLLARSLDEREIRAELARHVQRVVPCRGVVIAYPDVEEGTVRIGLHIDGAAERTRGTEPLGPGALADVARTGRAVRLNGIGADPAAVTSAAQLVGGPAVGVGSILAVPMLLGIRLIGVVAVYGSARTAFNADDEDLLGTIAAHAASAIVNARLYEESERERRQSEALSEIARAVGESLRVSEVLRLIQRHATALLRARGATVMLRRGEFLHVVAASGSGEVLAGMYLPMTSLSGRAVRTGQSVVSNDVDRDPETYPPTRELAAVRRTVIAPLVTDRGAIGALGVVDRDTEFTENDAAVLQRLADHVAVAIVNARLYEELSDATRELAVTFDAIGGGLAVVDDDGRLLRCNRRGVELLGAPSESAVHRRPFGQLLLGERDDDAWPLASALAERAAQRGTVRHAHDGRVFDVLASPHPSGGAVVFFDDVTSFHALADRYRDLMENASDAIYTFDRQATITSANAATAALLDVPREQLIGRNLVPFLEPDELETLREDFRAALGGSARRYECHLVRPDGTQRLLSVSNTPIRQGDEVVGVLGIARDVTVERAAAAALERAEARYTRLVESASDAIFTVDEEGAFTSVNRALEGAVGKTRDQLIGTHLTEIVEPADRGVMWEMFIATLRGENVRREVRYDGAHGTAGTANIVTAPIIEGGRVVGALGILRDVTEERALMQQFIRQERLAALGQLVSGVAHELNNPLAGISAHGQLLEKSIAKGDEVREAARVITKEAKRASGIVGKLLAFVRQGDAERIPVDLNLVLKDTIGLRAYAIREQKIDLITRLAEGLPYVLGDPAQLQQVFVNLLANAEHAVATSDGALRIEVATEHVAGKVRVLVIDTGVGIPPEHIDRIFNPFFTTKPRGMGTGLGLSISDGIVREHGGRLLVQSSPGAGTTFLVKLPAHHAGAR